MQKPTGCKLFTLSYDDGVVWDQNLISILNRYRIPCTFNLNSSYLGSDRQWKYRDLTVSHLSLNQAKPLYAGHEIAVHTCTHPHLEEMDAPGIHREIAQDQKALAQMFSTDVCGMAYPYGTYNKQVLEQVRACGIAYSRTTVSTHDFSSPADWLQWHFTCHHKDKDLMDLARSFCRSTSPELEIFSVWGHSYEFEGDDNWHIAEELCQLIARQPHIRCVTNRQAQEIIRA